jgi:hypothetical protein
MVKAIGGAVVGGIGAVGAVKLWLGTKRQQREEEK